MAKASKKLVIGLLGGIGSGKSAVAAELAKLGCAVIDADKLAKDALDEPAIQNRIIEQFGREILSPAGKIDRSKLAKIVFSNAGKLSILTNIIHPRVLAQTQDLIAAYQSSDCKAIVLDVPLLAEVGWEKHCDVLVFVDTSEKIRHERLEKRGLNAQEVKIRENFQISLDKKAAISDYSVNNNSDLSELAQQVSRTFNRIVKNA